jgi:hypothetical protein
VQQRVNGSELKPASCIWIWYDDMRVVRVFRQYILHDVEHFHDGLFFDVVAHG